MSALLRSWGLRRRHGPYLIFILALLVRLAYILQYSHSPFYLMPQWDAADYHDIARALAHGHLDPAFPYRPPLYPLFLSCIYALFGSGPLIPRIVQLLLGAYSCLLVYRIARNLYGETAGLAAGVIAALCGMMFYFDLELLPTTLEVLLLLLLLDEMTKPGEHGAKAWRAGLWFGLGVMARPTALAILPIIVLYLWRKVPDWRTMARFGAIPAGLLAASIAGHLAAGYGPVLVSAQGGVNSYIGNHHHSDGFTAYFPGLGTGWGWDQVNGWATDRAGVALNASQVDHLYYREGFQEIVSHPGDWIRLMVRKAALFWNRTEIPNNADIYYLAHRFWVLGRLLWLGFPVLLPAALAGIALGLGKPEVRLLAGIITLHFLSTIAFFVTARFRHPLTPILIVLAVGCASELIPRLRSRFKSGLMEKGGASVA